MLKIQEDRNHYLRNHNLCDDVGEDSYNLLFKDGESDFVDVRLKELYEGLRDWVQVSLDTYRPELRALLFPFFVHCYLELVQGSDLEQAASLLRDCREEHAVFHRAELNLLSQVTAPSHLATHEFAKRVRGRRFEVSLSAQSRVLLFFYILHFRGNAFRCIS